MSFFTADTARTPQEGRARGGGDEGAPAIAPENAVLVVDETGFLKQGSPRTKDHRKDMVLTAARGITVRSFVAFVLPRRPVTVEARSAPIPAPPPPTKPGMAPRQLAGTGAVPIVRVQATTPPLVALRRPIAGAELRAAGRRIRFDQPTWCLGEAAPLAQALGEGMAAEIPPSTTISVPVT